MGARKAVGIISSRRRKNEETCADLECLEAPRLGAQMHSLVISGHCRLCANVQRVLVKKGVSYDGGRLERERWVCLRGATQQSFAGPLEQRETGVTRQNDSVGWQ